MRPRSSKLKAVAPKAAEPSKPKVLIYGKPGVGKTWTALDFPACYFIDTEGGANLPHYTEKLHNAGGVYFGPDQGSTSFDAVMEQIRALATEDHGYKTVVIDSISKLFALEITREGERLTDAGKKNEFGADKKPAVGYMRQLVSWLMRLDMNAILIAHEIPEWGTDSKGERAQIGATFDCWPKLEYELHLALNIIKAGPSRLARVRKSRLLGFPDASGFPWTYDEFADRYGKDVIEKAATQLLLATPEQVAEISRLLAVVKVEEGRIEKWFSAANVSAWDEMDSEKVAKVIEYLKERIAA